MKNLFSRRFKNVWLKQDYFPRETDKTIYYLNHNSWWDGIIPFLLNEYVLHQRARALMESRQMKRYTFFRKIGAFSVERDNPRSVIRSLRYAIQSMNRDRASLFIYPEGKLTHPGSDVTFEGGLSWISTKLENIHYVPTGLHIHTLRYDKPELHIHIGSPVALSDNMTKEQRTREFEGALEHILEDLKKTAGFSDLPYRKLI